MKSRGQCASGKNVQDWIFNYSEYRWKGGERGGERDQLHLSSLKQGALSLKKRSRKKKRPDEKGRIEEKKKRSRRVVMESARKRTRTKKVMLKSIVRSLGFTGPFLTASVNCLAAPSS
mmetsp:Transcript_42123/g.83163  ORF Transcript_42123/g.83163 Transcript_42123/m.83163 type:complete len:118 (+) Transcript_42123:1681-2034(+)